MGHNPGNSRCDAHPSARHAPRTHSERNDGSQTSVKWAVLLFLEHRGPTPIDEIITAIDSHPIRVEKACSDLQYAGVLHTHSCGVYEVLDDESHRILGQE